MKACPLSVDDTCGGAGTKAAIEFIFHGSAPMKIEGGLSVEVIAMGESKLGLESNLKDEEFAGHFDRRHDERRMVAREGMVERRVHTRYAVDAWAEVLVKDGTMLFRGRVLDLSVGGCYIETQARLKLAPGTPVEMVFRLNEDVFRCDAMSRMVRTTGAGFLFANQDASMQRELERLIQELERGE